MQRLEVSGAVRPLLGSLGVKMVKAYWFHTPTGLTPKNYTFCPQCTYLFCIYLRTISDLFHLHHKLIGFYDGDEKCLQRGMDWVIIQSSLRFVFKGLILLSVTQFRTG